MDCHQAQANVLDWLEQGRTSEGMSAVDAHVANCATCRAFVARHRALDARLALALAPPALSGAFRATLRRRIREDRRHLRPVWLLDLVHVASCAVATGVCSALLPINALATLAGGAVATAISYVLLMMVRNVFEAAEDARP